MAVGLAHPENILSVAGIRLGVCSAPVYKKHRDDLVVLELAESTNTAAVFTLNKFAAAPVQVAKQHLELNTPKHCLINAGNANAGTGKQGLSDCLEICSSLANHLACDVSEILPFSTGVIGERLPIENIKGSWPRLMGSLSEDNWIAAANAIMTTDTIPKAASRQMNIQGTEITVTGIAKGSGMIKPNMATMLSYIATDLKIDHEELQDLLKQNTDQSFNRITVDGDTSTNDACVLFATAKSELAYAQLSNAEKNSFEKILSEVFIELAQAIIRDAEGASKFVSIQVESANTEQEALELAYLIAHSPLVKTALFASDPNWGRVLAVVGRSEIKDLDINQVEIYLNDICIVREGGVADEYTEQQGQAAMQANDIDIRIQLGQGQHSALVWTSDLSYDYVRINAEYRT